MTTATATVLEGNVSPHRAHDDHPPTDPAPGDPLGVDQAPHPAQHPDRHRRRVLILIGVGAIAAAVSTGSVTTAQDGGGFANDDSLSTVLTGANFAVLLGGWCLSRV